jgi:hypothetical protein
LGPGGFTISSKTTENNMGKLRILSRAEAGEFCLVCSDVAGGHLRMSELPQGRGLWPGSASNS